MVKLPNCPLVTLVTTETLYYQGWKLGTQMSIMYFWGVKNMSTFQKRAKRAKRAYFFPSIFYLALLSLLNNANQFYLLLPTITFGKYR